MDASPAPDDPALALVHQGWRHLRLQRPLAAWASWQQALRLRPEDPAAAEALERLAGSPTLPLAATRVYRLRGPEAESRRAGWDRELRAGDLTDLAAAERAFARLAALDPDDAGAWYNLGLCRAWRGENLTALGALHRFVALTADRDFDAAADAWTLAEVLRHGAGAEEQADDLSWTLEIPWDESASEPRRLLDAWPFRRLPTPQDPLNPSSGVVRAYELIGDDGSDLPRVEATLVVTPGRLRISTLHHPGDGRTWAEMLRDQCDALGLEGREVGEEQAHVLPLHLLDSAAWTFRPSSDLDPQQRSQVVRDALEDYYTDEWDQLPRHGLATDEPAADRARPPWWSADRIFNGDQRAGAQLEGVLRLREQLALRPQFTGMYEGFSFDRVRERFRLPPRWSTEPGENGP